MQYVLKLLFLVPHHFDPKCRWLEPSNDSTVLIDIAVVEELKGSRHFKLEILLVLLETDVI